LASNGRQGEIYGANRVRKAASAGRAAVDAPRFPRHRELRHNPANPALLALKEQIEVHRVVLHTTDISLLEVRRQIHERVLARQRELGGIERDFRRWRKQAPRSTPKAMLEFDAEALSNELFERFRRFLLVECRSEVHQALEVAPEGIFGKYFDRKPPFDGQDSKEFPDAFVVEALAHWAETQDEKVHVVTEDKAMTRAVQADLRLLALNTIHDVLARAAADLGARAEAIADALLSHPTFDMTLERLLKAQMKEATYVYTGDLAEGEAYEGELLVIEAVGDWSVVSLNAHRINLILDVTAKVRVEVQFEDRDSATYDREDDRWFGVENASTEVEDEVNVEVLVEVNRSSGEVVDAKVLTAEIEVFGPSDYD
jgi:PIN domain